MRNERKYKVISLITTLLALLLLGNCAREYYRMESSVYRQHEEYVLKGAAAYAQNCVQCHGPAGEGVTGMPLNRTDLKVDYNSPAGKDVYEMIYSTLVHGRPGNPNHTQWERAPDGRWISYSTMPAWSTQNGGPYDTDYLKALTLFIMKPDGSQWGLVGTEQAPFQEASFYPDETGEWPLPDSLDTEVNASAKALLRNISKSACLECHAIGNTGSKIGPDLSFVGSWGLDQAFLENWIKNASTMPHEERMPVYWSANRATVGPALNLDDMIVSEGPHRMPEIPLTDEEVTILARYLMGLKYGE